MIYATIHRAVLLATLLAGMSLMCAIPANAQAKCDADPKWLPQTAQPDDKNPNSPDVDCPFYQAAWQHFLFATQPGANGDPDFFSYKNITDLFGRTAGPLFAQPLSDRMLSLSLRVAERPHDGPVAGQKFVGSAVTGPDVFQAGVRGLLIDQKGRPIYYGIHVNQNFDDFLTASNLKTTVGLLFAPSDLTFPKSVVELKSAWQIVDDANPPKNYITAKATVPVLKLQNGQIVPQKDNPRTVTVALLALHVVFVLAGHPEFIWSTFEHVDPVTGATDLTPSGVANPTGNPATDDIKGKEKDFILYKSNTPASQANTAIVTDQPLGSPIQFDEATQTFKTTAGGVAQTSIYRMFPGSKSDVVAVDDEVVAVNNSVGNLFPAADIRRNYRLAGGVWLQKPESFKLNVGPFDDSTLQGENRLSGMAMESFTQDRNCLACHNTTTVKNDTTNKPIISAKLLNVSHVLSKFLASQPPTFKDVRDILEQAMKVWTQANGAPNLGGHGPTFKWDTKANLLAAVGHGKQLIQGGQAGCGDGKGKDANLVIDLRKGLPLRMPRGGPFLDDAAIQRIEDWINIGCPD
jgi:hypothetical protein